MLSREVVERQQDVAILRQAVARGVILRSIFFQEVIERLVRSVAGLGLPGLVDVSFRLGLDTLWPFVKDVGRLVHPTALLTRRPEDLAQRGPKNPNAPSPNASKGACDRPRCFRSSSNSVQLCSLSR